MNIYVYIIVLDRMCVCFCLRVSVNGWSLIDRYIYNINRTYENKKKLSYFEMGW